MCECLLCAFFRMTVCYVSDHWAQYVSVTGEERPNSQVHSLSLEKLQLEYDHVFLRAVLHVLRNKRCFFFLTFCSLLIRMDLLKDSDLFL